MGVFENPCKGCEPPKREPGCHGWCKERAEWKAWHDEQKQAYYGDVDKDRKVGWFISDQITRMKRRQNRK